MDRKTSTALKRLLPKGKSGKWNENYFSWGGHLCATDGFGALAIPGVAEVPAGPKDAMGLIFRDTNELEPPVLFSVGDIEEALKSWPTTTDEAGAIKKEADPRSDEHLIALVINGEPVYFRMTALLRLCQSAKSLKRSMVAVTHATKANGRTTGYTRGTIGSAIFVVMPYLCTDESLPVRVSPYTIKEQYIDRWRVVVEGGVLVGYKKTKTDLNRVVTTAVDPDEFRIQTAKPKKKKLQPPTVVQISLLDAITQIEALP